MRNIKMLVVSALAMTVCGVGYAAALVSPATATINVSATIKGSCDVFTAAPLAFGDTYDPNSGSNLDVSTNLSLRCTKGTPLVSIALGAGNNGTVALRAMKSLGTSSLLNYTLYSDSTHNTLWGDGTSGTSKYPPKTTEITGSTVQIPVYGRIPSGQTSASVAADYTDAVVATLTF